MVSAEAQARLAFYADAVRRHPTDADAQNCLGNALLEAGRRAEAVAAYREALRLRPEHAPAHYNLGNTLLADGDAAAALTCYDAALAHDPEHAGSLNNRGNALRALGRTEEAAQSYAASLRRRPDLAGTHNNFAAALLALHRPEAALDHLDAALRLAPDDPEVCNNRGGALLALDRPAEALAAFRRAVALDPAHAQAQFGRAMALLVMGRWREGFAAYEWRWRDPRFVADTRSYAAPLWLGETDLAGRTLLLHAEQGLGDTIQFARYAPLLRQRGARVVLEVPPSLLRLLAPFADVAVPSGAALPAHDFRTPLLSLPNAFGTTPDSVPTASYLARPEPRAGLRQPGLNVAVTFAGSPDHTEDTLRSLPPALLEPLLALPGVCLHLLQHAMSAADAAWVVGEKRLRRAPPTGDFADTASVLTAMDLVVSVDTAVGHLAGALGLPVWLLLQHAADFRWLRGREDTPWYPTMRLFRQGPDRRWEPVVARVVAALRAA